MEFFNEDYVPAIVCFQTIILHVHAIQWHI